MNNHYFLLTILLCAIWSYEWSANVWPAAISLVNTCSAWWEYISKLTELMKKVALRPLLSKTSKTFVVPSLGPSSKVKYKMLGGLIFSPIGLPSTSLSKSNVPIREEIII